MFQPSAELVERSRMTAFARYCELECGRSLPGYAELHRFSVECAALFWECLLRFSGLAFEGAARPALVGDGIEQARFFPEVRLNYAENLLASGPGREDDRFAVTACGERGQLARLTRRELRDRVTGVARALAASGVRPGDRVVAVVRNDHQTAVACLAAASIGATWSSVSTDLAAGAVLQRFGPLHPTVLFAHRVLVSQGQTRSLDDHVREIAAGLGSLERLVSLDPEPFPAASSGAAHSTTLEALAATGTALGADESFPWRRLEFDHPLFILFSSGTTGAPKCIVHGQGGTLLEHWKELVLHSALTPDDKLYFHTTPGWMMWNWQLSALSAGTEIVLFDGSATFPAEDALWQLVGRERVTAFGTSPAYLQLCRDLDMQPRDRAGLESLRSMMSTGSILHDPLYDWVRERVGELPLQSISGGTDILGCFVLGNPNLPVHRGEAQCVSLGLDVRALMPDGSFGPGPGELVCARPFPSRPIGLLGDETGTRFHGAYFAQNPGLWTHGDLVQLGATGGARILGRSDGVINVRGIRIGPAEIYGALEHVPEVAEGMAVEQAAPREPGGSRIVLLVVLKHGQVLDRALTMRIKKEIKTRTSAAHVPAVVAQVPEVPVTLNNKRSERAARDVLNGAWPKNVSALKNPAILEVLRDHPELRVKTA